jgi:hypothetical protein
LDCQKKSPHLSQPASAIAMPITKTSRNAMAVFTLIKRATRERPFFPASHPNT